VTTADVPGAGVEPPWRALLVDARERLAERGVDNPEQEARWLVQRAAGFAPGELALGLDAPAPLGAATYFHGMLTRRLAGEPLQYVLERWSFRRLELAVDRRVLIPRPETEVLAGLALDECRRLSARIAVDLGTGSGAIALALADERPGLEVWATDRDAGALEVARANQLALGPPVADVRLCEGSWFDALPEGLAGQVDVIVSNPPYVSDAEMDRLPDEVRDWEPWVALNSGPDGLEDVADIVFEAPAWLARPGALLVEMAPHQVGRAAHLAAEVGFTSVSVWPDLAGRDRILLARR
jgi:release factor glutamine methyltransferase